ncbi:MAG: ArnT family glycosyltransferase, partial [Myxococcota bacterium]
DSGAIVPHLNGEIYGEKPPLFFWGIAGLVQAGVPVDAAPRLISIVASLLVVLLVPLIGSHLGMAPGICGRATVMLATTPLFLLYGAVGLLDPLFAFLITAAIAAKLARGEGARGAKRALLAVMEGLFLGAAMLTKGPVCLLFPAGLRLGAAFSGSGRTGRADRTDLIALGVALACVSAWLAAAARVAGPEYVRDLTLGQVARRVAGSVPHRRPRLFMPLLTFIGLFPWVLFGLGGLWRAWKAKRLTRMPPGAEALAGWVIVPLIVFTLIPSQQPHYVLPFVPAGALLLAYAVQGAGRGVTRIFGALCVLVGAVLVIGWPLLRLILPPSLFGTRLFGALQGDTGLYVAGTGAGIAVCLGGLALTRHRGGPAAWKPTAALLVLFFAGTVLLTWQAGPVIMPRSFFRSPVVAGAPALSASESLRSTVRIGTGRREVARIDKYHVLEKLTARPGLVAVIWAKDYHWLKVRGDPVETLEVLERGWVRGRLILALRLAPAGAP